VRSNSSAHCTSDINADGSALVYSMYLGGIGPGGSTWLKCWSPSVAVLEGSWWATDHAPDG